MLFGKTGNAPQSDIELFRKNGADNELINPVRGAELLRAIKAALPGRVGEVCSRTFVQIKLHAHTLNLRQKMEQATLFEGYCSKIQPSLRVFLSWASGADMLLHGQLGPRLAGIGMSLDRNT